MKNIRITPDDETYRRLRIRAAELETSVSALVKRYLVDLAGYTTEFERLEKLERTLRDRVVAFRARAHSVRLKSAERNVPVETPIARARFPDMVEPRAVPPYRETLQRSAAT